MNKKLREADARAVDLILDRALAARGNGGGNGGMFAAGMLTATHVAVSNERVSAAEKVLHLLNAMPTAEPASDLVQRTLDRIAASTASPMRGQAPSLIEVGRPHA
jgi:hypothetical protein